MPEEKYLRPKLRSANPLYSFLQKAFLNQKLNNWLGYFLISCIAGGFGYLIATDTKTGLMVLGLVVGFCIVTACLVDVELALYINMVYAFIASHISRLLFNDNFPFGVVADTLIGVSFLALFIRKHDLKKNTNQFFQQKPIVFLFLVFLYLCLEIFNPAGRSLTGWFQIIRKVAEPLFILFIAYNIFSDYAKIRRFLKVLFCCAVLAGLYGCVQQWHGLFGFEENWVRSDQTRFELIYIYGNFRKFSFFSGPTEYGIIMAACALLFMIIGIYEKKAITRYTLIVGAIIMIMGMSYSGTRTANAMIVGGACVFILLTIHKKATQIFTFFAVMAFLFVMYAPIYSNLTILRFRSSFSASEDASYNVRERNRAAIRPYIYSHPFGGGLSTTGANGKEYNPGHPLAGFPPDSSYLSKALETGWVGLALTCILYFLTLQYVINGYFRSASNRIKTIFAASSAFFFSHYLGEMAQEAVGVFVNMVVYYPMLALVARLKQFSTKIPVAESELY